MNKRNSVSVQVSAGEKEMAAQRAILGDRAVHWAARFEEIAAELLTVKQERARLQAECEQLRARVAELEGQPADPEDTAAA